MMPANLSVGSGVSKRTGQAVLLLLWLAYHGWIVQGGYQDNIAVSSG